MKVESSKLYIGRTAMDLIKPIVNRCRIQSESKAWCRTCPFNITKGLENTYSCFFDRVAGYDPASWNKFGIEVRDRSVDEYFEKIAEGNNGK